MLNRGIRIIQMKITLFIFWAVIILAFSCEKSMVHTPVKIIFDTDMGSDCDDVGALALLHQYADQGKVDILGCVYSSGRVPYGAGIVEAINIYYGRPDIPVGAYQSDNLGDPVDKMTAEKLAKDTAAFKNQIVHNKDAMDQTKLCRKLLSEQPDTSVVYVTVGHTKGLYDLLVSSADEYSDLDGVALVRKKIKKWVALGALNANNKEGYHTKDWNFFFNGTAPYTKYLVEHFSRPVDFVHAGADVITGQSLKNTPSGNILRTAYRDWLWNVQNKTLDDGRPSWDLVTVQYAVEGLGPFLQKEDPGYLEFDVEKGCRWVKSGKAFNHQYIYQKEDVDKALAAYLNEKFGKLPENNKNIK